MYFPYLQPFDESRFNFKKAFLREVIFTFEPASTVVAAGPNQCAADIAKTSHPSASTIVESSVCGSSPNLVMINVSPSE